MERACLSMSKNVVNGMWCIWMQNEMEEFGGTSSYFVLSLVA